MIYFLSHVVFVSCDRKQPASPVLSWSCVSAGSSHCRTSSHSSDRWSSSVLFQDHRQTSPPEEFRVKSFLCCEFLLLPKKFIWTLIVGVIDGPVLDLWVTSALGLRVARTRLNFFFGELDFQIDFVTYSARFYNCWACCNETSCNLQSYALKRMSLIKTFLKTSLYTRGSRASLVTT